MYFPLLRGKQNELLALRECKEQLAKSGKVIPIIEPVTKGHSNLIKCLNELGKEKVDHIVIYNSNNGDVGKDQDLCDEIICEVRENTETNHFALVISSTTHQEEIKNFIKNIGNCRFSFIHESSFSTPEFLIETSKSSNFQYHIFTDSKVSRLYKKKFSSFKIVNINCCFRAVSKNADFAEPNLELFSDAHLTYIDDGYYGFGDFTVLPEKFKSNGFQPYTAALHLTYEVRNTYEVWVRHFLSEIYDYPTSDQAKLIHEALPELVTFINKFSDYFEFSSAVKELLKIHDEGKSTNLGYIKKLSIKHHLELMMKVLSSQ
ncbi:sce7725 family protein [Photobacterium kasasachensis]|uniref:sce7725 family protein n=1 Tax=Photobacterium kasasachensis TaxID=2910240 RepID=UPI003D0C686D